MQIEAPKVCIAQLIASDAHDLEFRHTRLIEKLNELPIEGVEHAQYYLVNMATGEYIFHPDTEKITTIAEEQFVKERLEKLDTTREVVFVAELDGKIVGHFYDMYYNA